MRRYSPFRIYTAALAAMALCLRLGAVAATPWVGALEWNQNCSLQATIRDPRADNCLSASVCNRMTLYSGISVSCCESMSCMRGELVRGSLQGRGVESNSRAME